MVQTDDDDGHGFTRRSAVCTRDPVATTTLLVEAQDLQLDGEVDLAERDASRHGEDGRCEVQDGCDAGGDQAVRDLLGGPWRGWR